MSVIPLTIFFSLILAFLFIAFFMHDQYRRRFASSESDSLLPLAPETPRPVETEQAGHHAEHEREHDGCGCRSGKHAPCPGCLKSGQRSVKPTA